MPLARSMPTLVLAAAPFREPEPGYLSRVFEEEESGEWDLLSIVIYFAVAVALAP
jgi:hypothetical protein